MTSRFLAPALTVPFEKDRTASLSHADAITVEPIRTDAALADLKEGWETLETRTAAPNPFLTWGWMSAWWRHFGKGRRLEVLAVRNHGELIGIAPFYRETVRLMGLPFRRLALLGDDGVGSDHLDLIARKGDEAAVAAAVARAWREESCWDFVHCRGFAEGSPSLPALTQSLGAKWIIEQEEGEVCPYLPLDATWEGYLQRLSGSMRYTIRRKMRNLEKDCTVELAMLEDSESGRAGMARLLDLHEKRWSAQGGSAAFVSAAKIPFHRETADSFFEKGIAKLFFLNVNQETVASLYGFSMGGKFFYYQAGFDPAWGDRSVGMVLMGKSIQAAITQGWSEFDFLRGAEAYKAHWTSSERHIWTVSIYPPRFRSVLYRSLSAIKREGKGLVKKMILALLPEGWIKKLQARREGRS